MMHPDHVAFIRMLVIAGFTAWAGQVAVKAAFALGAMLHGQ